MPYTTSGNISIQQFLEEEELIKRVCDTILSINGKVDVIYRFYFVVGGKKKLRLCFWLNLQSQ
ncbi:hypothetical protein GCM10011508_13450 [Flavobacterium lutivivi]|nr:hypothetical protein GCM10011508_13450 [Flavobacterium lutivivi]